MFLTKNLTQRDAGNEGPEAVFVSGEPERC